MTDTKTVDTAPVIHELQALIARHGTQQAAADAIGIDQSTLNLVMHGLRTPGPKILRPLGMVKVITFRKAPRV